MLHKIESEKLICTLESQGAEIRSLINKETGEEYIWQIDKDVWGSSSPVLFPAIGSIKGGKVLFNEKEYAMPKHGIIRNNNVLVYKSQSSSSCSFTLETSKETLKQYPFKFSFSVEYTLIEQRLIMNYRIENKGGVPMHFACGGHTAYACPLDANTQLSDYVVEFPKPLELHANMLGEYGFPIHSTRAVESKDGILPLSNTLFDDDSLVFSDIDCDWIRIRKREQQKGIVVRFSGYPHLALWSKPAADYLCVEPWLGLPDCEDESTDITQKHTYKTIAPDTTFTIAIETEIE